MFDRYDLRTSLKESTRERRQGGKPVITYHVANNTPVEKVSAKQFLSSTISSSSACPELERSGFHEVLPVFSILGASLSRVETMIMRLEICSQGT